eukprot:499213_1
MTTALKQKPEFVWQKTAPLTASNLKKRNQAITKELQEQGYMTNDQRVKTDTVVAQTGKVPAHLYTQKIGHYNTNNHHLIEQKADETTSETGPGFDISSLDGQDGHNEEIEWPPQPKARTYQDLPPLLMVHENEQDTPTA